MSRKALQGWILVGLGLVLALAPVAAARAGVAGAAAAGGVPSWAESVIRLHVVANSDSDADQNLKRAVRDAVLETVTPRFEYTASADEARAIMQAAIPEMERVAGEVIAAAGQSYPVRAEFGRFAFPGKAYGAFYLPAGDYYALKLMIGEAAGANWWCVLFPPMCFIDWSAGVVLEPKAGTSGKQTVAVPARKAMGMVTEEKLAKAKVKPRSALLTWLKGKRNSR